MAYVTRGMINAIYALYGKPEPGPETPIIQIERELDQMAKERREQNLNTRIYDSLDDE